MESLVNSERSNHEFDGEDRVGEEGDSGSPNFQQSSSQQSEMRNLDPLLGKHKTACNFKSREMLQLGGFVYNIYNTDVCKLSWVSSNRQYRCHDSLGCQAKKFPS
jgi:hypothetical protein